MYSLDGGGFESDKISERLKKDSEEITRSLDQFLIERQRAADAQTAALEAYEEELRQIGDIEEENDEQLLKETDERGNIDHTLMHHLNATVVAGGDDDDEENPYGCDSYEQEIREAGLSHSLYRKENTKKDNLPIVSFEKRTVPNPEVKRGIRTKMFNFLDEAHEEEKDLESKLYKLKAVGEEGEARANAISEQLFELQKRNHEKLMEYITDYNPRPSGKKWTNDPDYHIMMNQLKSRFESL